MELYTDSGESTFLAIRCSTAKTSLEPVGESASRQLADEKKVTNDLIEG